MRSALLLNLLFLFPQLVTAGEFTNFGKIYFQKADTWVFANKTCLHEQNFYHQTKDFIEKISCSGSDDSRCEVWKTVPLVQPVHSYRFFCSRYSEDECVDSSKIRFLQDPNVRFEVYSSQKAFRENERPLKKGWYRVPGCY